MDNDSVTQLLVALRDGCAPDDALDRLYHLVYDDLKEVADRAWAREFRAGHTLQPTALVHEAFLRLSEATRIPATDRKHLLAIMAIVIKRVLVDHARRRNAGKRGAGVAPAQLDSLPVPAVERGADLVEVADLVDQLAAQDARAGRVALIKIFTGASHREIARELGVSASQVDREWAYARSWLQHALGEGSTSRVSSS